MKELENLLEVMGALRNPDGGCPWDREQTFESIAPYTIEEAYEVAEAIAAGKTDDLRDELGDLLFQVVFHAEMAREQGWFEFRDVAAAISDKLVRRHPHVFDGSEAVDATSGKRRWEEVKAAERAERHGPCAAASALDGLSRACPALIAARKLGERAASVGFDWSDAAGARAKIDEELAELDAAADSEQAAEECGDLLLAIVNYCRHRGIDAEEQLRRSNRKFERRFRAMERCAHERAEKLDQLPPDRLDALWNRIKSADG